MKSNPPTYVVAVSGGVDSSVLLHMIANDHPDTVKVLGHSPGIVVAHVNHGIRATAERDQKFVEKLAESYGYKFETIELGLGKDASEEEARDARYEFFDHLQRKYHAKGVVLAHHRDDVVETAVINIIRGTGRKGLSSLKSTPDKIRPLLHLTKSQVLQYASNNKLDWVEDETNSDPKYLRNKIRIALTKSDELEREKFATSLQKINEKNDLLESEIANLLQYKCRGKAVLSRSWFVLLPHSIATEVVHAILSRIKVQNIDSDKVERLTIAIKVAQPGSRHDIDRSSEMIITKRSARFVDRQSLHAHKI